MTIVEKLFTELDILLKNYTFNGYNALVHALKYPLGLAVTLYIMLVGFSIAHGWVKMSMSNFVKSAVKIGLIYTFAMNWAYFSEYAIKLVQGGAGELGGVLLNATPIPLPHLAGEGINGAMQTVLIEVTKIGHWIWGVGSWHNMSPYFTALIIWVFGFILIGVAILELAMAKIMLAVLFTTAPLFVAFTLFKPTHNFFDRWLGAIVGFALVIVFVSAVLALALSIMQWTIADMYVTHAIHVTLVGFVPVMIGGILGVGMLISVCKLAQHIGGMVSTSSGSSLLAGTVGGAMGASLTALKLPGGVLGTTKKLFGMGVGIGAAAASKGAESSSAISSIQKDLRKGS